ncbi:YueH family protein [Jeotgalibacillus marinus]|uniref:YueH family protein n=1 Tax=Jeotgalibacillus marinus TaxID=86667 RepID=A0ABV3Q8E9_9BACL
MKIRNSFGLNEERKVFIHENKKEESVLVAIPSLSWSTYFSYDEYGEQLVEDMISSLKQRTEENEATELAQRINQWTREM